MGFMKSRSRGDAERIVGTALDEGINFIDTARAYYNSEEIIGRAIAGRRDQCYLATKSFARSASAVQKDVEISLRNLRTERIELYQIHHVQYEHELEQVLSRRGALAALLRAQQQGKITFIGVSCHHPQMALACLKTGQFDVIQIALSPVETHHFAAVEQIVKADDVGVVAMKPLAGGVLKSVDSALKFVLSHDVSTVVAGCSTIEHVKADAHIGHTFTKLSAEEKQRIIEDVKHLPEDFCRRCGYCERNCPRSLPIPEVFRCEAHLIMSPTYARTEYKPLAERMQDCRDCGQCEEVCPYGLPVRDLLHGAHDKLTKGKLVDGVTNFLHRLRVYDVVKRVFFALGGGPPEH